MGRMGYEELFDQPHGRRIENETVVVQTRLTIFHVYKMHKSDTLCQDMVRKVPLTERTAADLSINSCQLDVAAVRYRRIGYMSTQLSSTADNDSKGPRSLRFVKLRTWRLVVGHFVSRQYVLVQ